MTDADLDRLATLGRVWTEQRRYHVTIDTWELVALIARVRELEAVLEAGIVFFDEVESGYVIGQVLESAMHWHYGCKEGPKTTALRAAIDAARAQRREEPSDE